MGRADAGIFSSGNDLYVLGGINFPAFTITSACKRYDLTANSWSSESSYGGGSIVAPVCVATDNAAFVGTGQDASFNASIDWWKFATATSINKIKDESEIKVYPNPFSDEINIFLSMPIGQYKIEIFDVLGKLIYNETNDKMENTVLKIDASFLCKGIYQLRQTNSSNNQIVYQSIVKQ